jgi:DNA repair protein RadA
MAFKKKEEFELDETDEKPEDVTDDTIESIPGVGEKIADKLKECGYEDLMAIAVSPSGQLADDVGMAEATAKKIISNARAMLKMNFMDAEELLEKRKNVGRITTGCKEFDDLIGGGVESQSITETFGEYGSGKTQIGLQLVVNVQLPVEKGGLDGYAVFIDTENTFRPKRVIQMAEALGLDPKKVMSRIKVARAYSSDHQILLTEKIPDLITNEKIPVKLVVVDSLTGLFRSEYIGRGTLATRQQKLNRHLHTLQRLADRYNLAIYVTNQVMSRPDVFFGDPTKAVGGHVLGHAATYRLYLRKSKGGKRVARLIDSPSLPDGEALFMIDEKGIHE